MGFCLFVCLLAFQCFGHLAFFACDGGTSELVKNGWNKKS